MIQTINYSIIIPHKNIPKLLQRCLDSIPQRKDIQIIVIDDNSDSDKVDFERFPGLEIDCVKTIFTKEGKGAGYARNLGLAAATGKWLLFADADDFFNYCINDVFDEYIDSKADIIFFKNTSMDSELYTFSQRRSEWSRSVGHHLSTPTSQTEYLLRYFHVVPWAKMFKRDFIIKNHILFDEIPFRNDVTFGYVSGFYAKDIIADSRALYCVTDRLNSLTTNKMTIEIALLTIYVWGKRYRFLVEHSILDHQKYFLGFLIVRSYKWYFFNGFYDKAKDVLIRLGFTHSEIIGLCIGGLFVHYPLQKIKKLLGIKGIY